jgi:hypothetical protein
MQSQSNIKKILQQRCVQIWFYGTNPNLKIEVETTDANVYTPLSKVYIS